MNTFLSLLSLHSFESPWPSSSLLSFLALHSFLSLLSLSAPVSTWSSSSLLSLLSFLSFLSFWSRRSTVSSRSSWSTGPSWSSWSSWSSISTIRKGLRFSSIGIKSRLLNKGITIKRILAALLAGIVRW